MVETYTHMPYTQRERLQKLMQGYDAVYIDTNMLFRPLALKIWLKKLKLWLAEGHRLRVRSIVVEELKHNLEKEENKEAAQCGLDFLEAKKDCFEIEDSPHWEGSFHIADIDFFSLFAAQCEQRNQLLITADTNLQESIRRINTYIKSPHSPYTTSVAQLVEGYLQMRDTEDLLINRVLKEYKVFVSASALRHPHAHVFLSRCINALQMQDQTLHVLPESLSDLSHEEQQQLSALPDILPPEQAPAASSRSELSALCAELVLHTNPLLITCSPDLVAALQATWPRAIDKSLNDLTTLGVLPNGELDIPPSLFEGTPSKITPVTSNINLQTLKQQLPTMSAEDVATYLDIAIRGMHVRAQKLLAACPQLAQGVEPARTVLMQWLKTHLSGKKGSGNAFSHPCSFDCMKLAMQHTPLGILKQMSGFIETHLEAIQNEKKRAKRQSIWRACELARDFGMPWPEMQAENTPCLVKPPPAPTPKAKAQKVEKQETEDGLYQKFLNLMMEGRRKELRPLLARINKTLLWRGVYDMIILGKFGILKFLVTETRHAYISGAKHSMTLLTQWVLAHRAQEKGRNNAFGRKESRECFLLALSQVPRALLTHFHGFIESLLQIIEADLSPRVRLLIWELCLAAQKSGIPWPIRAADVQKKYAFPSSLR